MQPFHNHEIRHRSAPDVETERLLLRSFVLDDYLPFRAMMGEPDVFRHIGGEPIGTEEAMRRLSMYVGFWSLNGCGMWAVEDKASGKLVGQVGLFDMHRDLQPPPPRVGEMGWIFATEAQGKGFAREAASAALAWFEREYGPQDLFAIIAVENEPSMKLAQRLGFERLPDAVYKDAPISVWLRNAG